MPSYNSVVMERGHYGNAGVSDNGSEDVNSASSSFALDYAGMLDAADSVLHQQIYEYLQGPAVQQSESYPGHQFLSNSDSLDQGPGGSSTFPGQASQHYPGGPPTSFPELSTFQTGGHTNFVTDHTSSSHILSRRDGSTSTVLDYYRRKEQSSCFKTEAGIESLEMLPSGMGSCSTALSAQLMYNGDHVFHPPPAHQPNLVYNGREFSGYETSCSPNVNHLKRPGCEPDILSPHEPRPRPRKSQKIEPVKSQRPAEQAEHIMRERQRRDDMTSKFLMLEALLPPGPKRDRSTVVDDSIQYVKSLHHRVKELHGKLSEMKSNNTSGCLKKLSSDQKTHDVRADTAAATVVKKNPVMTAPESESKSSGSIEKIEVHLDLPHQIVVDMTCRPHPHIQSQIMVALERLGTDVSRCSIAKHHHRLICILVVKPREMTEPLITGDDVIRALTRAMSPDE